MTISDQAEIEGEMTVAQTVLDEGKLLFANEHLSGAISRAYYAAFHATRALLWSLGHDGRTHKGVLSQLGEYVIKIERYVVRLQQLLGDVLSKNRP